MIESSLQFHFSAFSDSHFLMTVCSFQMQVIQNHWSLDTHPFEVSLFADKG